MLPMMVAESNLHRASGRENGTTAATWEMVNGIKYLRCHRTVIVQPYKLRHSTRLKYRDTPHGQRRYRQPRAPVLAGRKAEAESSAQYPRRGRHRDGHHICRIPLGG